jgi:FlaA1/EpsC-like NDP-sugar epimerase
MATAFRLRTLTLFIGDLAFLVCALWLSLYIRTFSVPDNDTFVLHLMPFSLIFLVSLAVFMIAGLYETRSVILARRAFSITLLVAQTFNVILAAIFFFLIPWFGIAPKTLLLIYLIVSFALILLWRVWVFPRLGFQRPEQAVVVGNSAETQELVDALHKARRAPAAIAKVISPESATLAEDITHAIAAGARRALWSASTNSCVSALFPTTNACSGR